MDVRLNVHPPHLPFLTRTMAPKRNRGGRAPRATAPKVSRTGAAPRNVDGGASAPSASGSASQPSPIGTSSIVRCYPSDSHPRTPSPAPSAAFVVQQTMASAARRPTGTTEMLGTPRSPVPTTPRVIRALQESDKNEEEPSPEQHQPGSNEQAGRVVPRRPSSAHGSAGFVSPAPSPRDVCTARTQSHGSQHSESVLAELQVQKARLAKCQQLIREKDATISALAESQDGLRNKNRKLHLQVDSLNERVLELESKIESVDATCKQNARDLMAESLPKHLLGIAYKVEKILSEWAKADTCEMVPFQKTLQRCWERRSEPCQLHGIKISDTATVVPLSPLHVASKASCYLPSLVDNGLVVRECVFEELKKDDWRDFFPDANSREETCNILQTNAVLKKRVKTKLSDAVSKRKRIAKDLLMSTYGYELLVTRATTLQRDASPKRMEETIAKQNLLRMLDNGQIDFSWWRTAPSQQLQRFQDAANGSSELAVRNEDGHAVGMAGELMEGGHVFEDNIAQPSALQLFQEEDSVFIYNAFVGWGVDETEDVPAGTIVSLARCDAWIATVVSCLGKGGGRGGGVQKLYHDRFSTYLVQAVSQLVGQVAKCVFDKYPSEVTFPDDIVEPKVRRTLFTTMERVATKVVTQPSTGITYVAVESQWFNDNISDKLGVIHDCYIAEIPEDYGTIELIGITSRTDTDCAYLAQDQDD